METAQQSAFLRAPEVYGIRLWSGGLGAAVVGGAAWERRELEDRRAKQRRCRRQAAGSGWSSARWSPGDACRDLVQHRRGAGARLGRGKNVCGPGRRPAKQASGGCGRRARARRCVCVTSVR